jgi:hypothetical protein
MSGSFADTVNALLGLINTSVQEVLSAYEDAGKSAPPLNSVDPGPFDSPQNTPLHVTKAIQIIEGACAQLCATIAPPGHTVLNVNIRLYSHFLELTVSDVTESSLGTARSLDCLTPANPSSRQFTEPVCLEVAIGAKISDLLLDKPEGLHVDELAELTGLNATKLGQILRLLATKHVYYEGMFIRFLSFLVLSPKRSRSQT